MRSEPTRACLRALQGPLGVTIAILLLALLGLLGPAPSGPRVDAQAPDLSQADGRELYVAACASCHGADGTGASPALLAFDTPVPDFTDCNFATREPDADWIAIAHQGGPTRAFARLMPAFGEALSIEQLDKILGHIRSFCPDTWPRGDLNLPRPLFTEKAYPEDEAVWTTTVDTEGGGAAAQELVYEQRFGIRNQLEIVVPFAWREEDGSWTNGVGDIAAGVKRVLFHDLETGSILSVTGEVIFPTGDEDRDFGKGTTIFEPFLSYGQLLPRGLFLHGQAGLELPLDTDRATEEAFARLALGRSFTQGGPWGRTWSPMVEVLAARELASGEDVNWDLVPQFQVTLNTRQHVMLNAGVRIPMNDTDVRETQALVYILWDWFDGGLFAGW